MAAPIPIVHTDDHLLIVAKPAGLLTVPAPGRPGVNLIDRLRGETGLPVQAVHRLDQDTTGALVVAITDVGRAGLETLFREHRIERVYLALVASMPSPAAGRIEARLQEDDGVMRVVPHGGELAITEYRALDRRRAGVLVECRLHTGKRNQIRAHLAALGCPLVGDRKYGYRARSGTARSRYLLHSWRLAFTHPVTATPISVTVPPEEGELRPTT
ncbi:MAG: RluA family pseudouridine synthase [Planctomycetes bacterium]|nr:RluA family pseudouridine synthase [Planctomycetota bacterium]